MSIDLNRDLVRRHIDLAWNEARFGALKEVWAVGCLVHLANGRDVIGLESLKEHPRSVVLPWSDRVCRIEDSSARMTGWPTAGGSTPWARQETPCR
jgi:hypothetical protein